MIIVQRDHSPICYNVYMRATEHRPKESVGKEPLTFIELFAGIGGFRYAAENHGMKCVFASDIDRFCQQSYGVNFGDKVHGDITKLDLADIPTHDILLGG